MQYGAMVASSRAEMNLMARVYTSGVISRVGFAVQDMKNFENEISNAIENRANEINNNNAACLVEARSNLQASATVAGAAVSTTVGGLSEDLTSVYENYVYSVIDEVDLLISLFETEILNIFAYVNGVTSMFTLIIFLESEVRNYGALFEYFVLEIYVDMLIFDMLTQQLSQQAFPSLDVALNDFRSAGSSIRSSLINCN